MFRINPTGLDPHQNLNDLLDVLTVVYDSRGEHDIMGTVRSSGGLSSCQYQREFPIFPI